MYGYKFIYTIVLSYELSQYRIKSAFARAGSYSHWSNLSNQSNLYKKKPPRISWSGKN